MKIGGRSGVELGDWSSKLGSGGAISDDGDTESESSGASELCVRVRGDPPGRGEVDGV